MAEKESRFTDTKLRVGPLRTSYCYLPEPKFDKKKKMDLYSSQFIFPKSDKDMYAKLKRAVQKAAIKKFGAEKAKKLLKHPNFKLPVRDADREDKEEAAYKNCFFFNTTGKKQRIPMALRNGKKLTDVDEMLDEIYSGCWVYIVINVYGYDGDESKGVAIGLNSLMKYKDDDRLDGFSNVEDDFEDMFDGDASDIDDDDDWGDLDDGDSDDDWGDLDD